MSLFAVPFIVFLLCIPVNGSASLLQRNHTRRLRSGTAEPIPQLRECPTDASPFITKCTKNSKMDCYCIVSKRMDRAGAEKFCHDNGMYLVTLETETENNYVNNLANENRDAIENQFWTSGFNANLNPSNWVWDYSGLHPAEPFEYTNWCANEPNNFDRSEHFVAVINKCWHDAPGGIRWPSICKFQANIFDPVLKDHLFFFTHLGESELVIPCRPSTAFYTGARVDISKYINDMEVPVQIVSNGSTENNNYEYDPLKGFIIRNVSSNEDGKYNCSITIDQGNTEAWMIFHIVIVGIQIKIDREFDPLEGDNVSLTCDPQQLKKRQPPFDPVKWFAAFTDKGDGNETALTPTVPVLPTGAWMEFVDETGSALPQLRIFNVSTNLSGIYRCGFVFHSSNNSVHLTSDALSLNVLKKIDWSDQLSEKQLQQVLTPASETPDNYRVIPHGNDLRISCTFGTRGYLPYYQWQREQFEDDAGHNLGKKKETSSRITMTKTINAEDGTDNLTIFVTNVTTEDQGLFTCLLNGLPPVSVSQYIYVDDRKSNEDASITLRSTPSNEFFRVMGQQSIIPCRPVHPSIGMDIFKLAKNGQIDEIILNNTSSDDNYGYYPQKGFIIQKVTVADDGPYQCSPFGRFDPSIIFTITVVGVMIECVVGCETPPQRINGYLASQVDPAVESEKVELNCQGFRINDHSAVLDWFAISGGVQVKIANSKSHPGLKLGVTNTKNKILMRKLTISDVKMMNASTTYKCLMTAGKETYSESIELNILLKNRDKMVAIVTSVTIIIGVFSIAIAIALVYFYKNGERKFMRLEGLLQGDQSRLNHDLPLEEQTDLLPYDKRWEFPRNRLRLGKQLGVGCFGRVLQAEAVGINDGSNRAVSTVAVKTTRSQTDAAALEGLISELKILIHLGSHINILNLLGACTKAINRGEILVIVEYCCFGNLRSYLINHRDKFVSQVNESGELVTNVIEDCADDAITTSKLVCWAYQISRGMDYLVSKKVLHGDLAARNILLSENNVVKVADFGLSRCLYKDENYTKKTKSLLPLKWMAIESLTDQVWSSRSDVWSYGVVLWEIFSLGQTPYQGHSDEFQFVQALKSGYRMEKPENTPNCVASVMESCWNADPNLRPTFTQIEGTLDAPLESFVTSFYLQLNEDYQRLNAERMTLENFSVRPAEGYVSRLPLRPTSSCNFYGIDATFCAAKATDGSGVHVADLHKETCLITQENRPTARTLPYSFSTELFFLTHRALELGAKAVHSQMLQMSQNFSRLQRAYQDAEQSGQTPVVQQIQERMDVMMSSYLCFKAVLLVPEWLKLHFEFILATSKWLCATALGAHPSNVTSSDLSSNKEQTSELLSCIPEFCLSNVMDFVVFANRFSPSTLDRSKLDDLLTLVLVFMGSPNRLKNPHMRAAMAEMLDGLMPPDRGQASPPSSRTKLFVEHPRSKDVVRTLLHVFASIEMTGQGVAFEQKFNYRRPMYAAMKFLWSLKFHRRQFKLLAAEAEANMEAAQPPLFLQFVNLLINDAIYLLDEGLSYMAQLKEQQIQRNDGSWPNVPAGPQRHQREATYQHITMLARFHNLMGRETIRILDMMTTEVKGVFVHSTMVDRMASMLNYFLLHLVGPKKRDFKVKDFGDYEFDPAELVSCICQIYCHLSDADVFCTAVSQDGRSYSSQLFELAEDVLSRIGRGALIGDLRLVAEKVAKLATAQASDEDLISAAPDEFLDPIMSSIMMNPVILPSSRVTVDRSTIARHLLSDQSDPFNRSPLTMEEILPDDELRKRIHQWISEVKKKAVERDDLPQ